MKNEAGAVIVVVGPSGAGKDTLINYAQERLKSEARFGFVRRVITRAVDAGGEAHQEVSDAGFRTLEKNGAFALSWQAHGLSYGIPASTFEDLRKGHILIVNGSRHALPAFQDVYGAKLKTVLVTAPKEVLAERLAERGREDASSISMRLNRQSVKEPDFSVNLKLDNSGPIELAGERFIGFLNDFVVAHTS